MIKNISFWGWYAIITVGLFAIFNPTGYSIWHLWTLYPAIDFMPWNLLLTAFILGPMSLILYGTYKATSWIGLIMILVMIAILAWCTVVVIPGILINTTILSWVVQHVLSIILTLGWQWPRIWRQATGTVTAEGME